MQAEFALGHFFDISAVLHCRGSGQQNGFMNVMERPKAGDVIRQLQKGQ